MKKRIVMLVMVFLNVLQAYGEENLQQFLEDATGDYVIYHDTRGEADRLVGYLFLDRNTLWLRSLDRRKSEEYLLELSLDFTPSSCELKTAKAVRGDPDQKEISNRWVDLLNLYAQSCKVDRTRYPALVERIDPWPEFGYTLKHSFVYWVPIFQLLQTVCTDDPGVGSVTLVAFGRMKSREDQSFFEFRDVPASSAGPRCSLIQSSPRMAVLNGVGLLLDPNWIPKGDSFWISQKSPRDSMITAGSLNLEKEGFPGIYSFQKEVFLASDSPMLPTSVIVRPLRGRVYAEWDACDGSSKSFSRHIAITNEGGANQYVELSAFRSIYDSNTPYFQEIIQTAVFQNAEAFARQINDATELRNKGKIAEALAASDRAIAMNPASTLAYSIRGSLYLAQKKYEQAVADFSKAIELCPDRVDPYYNRACCFELLGRNADAVESFRTFLQAIPEGTQSYGALTDEVKDRLQRLGK